MKTKSTLLSIPGLLRLTVDFGEGSLPAYLILPDPEQSYRLDKFGKVEPISREEGLALLKPTLPAATSYSDEFSG